MPTLVQRPSTGSTTASPRKRRGTPWWQVVAALCGAILLFVGLAFLLAWAMPHWHHRPFKKGATPLTLTIQPPSEPGETPGLQKTEVVPQQPQYMRLNDEQKADTPPPDPAFISSTDANAAAEKAAEDPFKPLPTQDGKEVAAYDFTTRPYVPGKEAHDVSSTGAQAVTAAEPVPTPPPATPKPQAKAKPTPPPAAKPSPTPGEFEDLKADASPSNTPPEPSPSPREPTQDPLERQAAKIRQEDGRASSTAPRQPPGYQPQTVQTKMAGSINNHGPSSVSAKGTPLGRYQKAIEDAIGARWYFNVEENMSNLVRTGQVKVHFVITRAGKIINTRVEGSNSNANTTLADISLEAVVNAEVPPIPSEVAATLPGGQLEGDLTFIMY